MKTVYTVKVKNNMGNEIVKPQKCKSATEAKSLAKKYNDCKGLKATVHVSVEK